MEYLIDDPGEVLRRAKERLERPGAWTTGGAAYKFDPKYGRVVCSAKDPEASQWCLLGALMAEHKYVTPHAAMEALCTLTNTLIAIDPDERYGLVSEWNDAKGRTVAEVLAFIDEAISRVPVYV